MAFRIIRNDITAVTADAIVNTANPYPRIGNGTDSAIYNAAGRDVLLEERLKIGIIEVGTAAATPAFNLSAEYIIHTVGPKWTGGDSGEYDKLKDCYENSLKLAVKLGCKSIAFPLISTGIYRFPKEEALRIAIAVFKDFLLKNDIEIILVVFDKKSFVLSGDLYSGIDEFIDERYVSDQVDEEYTHYEPLRRKISEESLHSFGSKPHLSHSTRRQLSDACDFEEVMADSTENLYEDEADSLMDRVSHLGDTWQETLLKQIDDRGYTDTEVYKRANVDRKLFSKIRSNTDYQPKKITAVAFALALKLNLDETKDFIGRAGYAFSPSSKFDLIIEYFIEQQIYDSYTINLALFEHNQPLLGA